MNNKGGLITRRKLFVSIAVIASMKIEFFNWTHLFAAEKELYNMIEKNKKNMITPDDISLEDLLKEENRNKKIIHRFPALRQELVKQLLIIEPSVYGRVNYYPCKVKLFSGEIVDNVVIVEASSYFSTWGVWPQEDQGKKEIKLQDVKRIYSSEHRLPIKFSRKIKNYWETGMGYKLFYFIFKGGNKILAVCGGLCDFFDFNGKYKMADVIDVLPFDVNNSSATKPEIESAKYFWCLYS